VKRSHWLWLVVALASGVTVLVFTRKPSAEQLLPATAGIGAPLTATSEPSGAADRFRALREDARPEVRKLGELAAAANLYNFDPTIVGFRAPHEPTWSAFRCVRHSDAHH
jgi:hypothetical protein